MTADMKVLVRKKYGEIASRAADGNAGSCCGPSTCCGDANPPDPVTSDLYDQAERASVPESASRVSLGCGNPTALADLRPGEIVLDLGSGGGLDVLLSARLVGPEGKAYGLDMTDEMLSLARRHQEEAGAKNVEFLKGDIESIPLPDASVDVVISNCVINLSSDKDRALGEAFRVLRPGGRFAVSDIVVMGEVSPEIRRNVDLWIGCVAGALEESEYRSKLEQAGFTDVSIVPTRTYDFAQALESPGTTGTEATAVAHQATGKVLSAFIRASKPATSHRS